MCSGESEGKHCLRKEKVINAVSCIDCNAEIASVGKWPDGLNKKKEYF